LTARVLAITFRTMISRTPVLPLLIGLLALSIGLASPSAFSAPPAAERYEGFDLAKLAEATERSSVFRTQRGEAKGREAFAAWLRAEGLTKAGYDAAYAAWWERFRADPTGQLEARFHRVSSEWSQTLNYADAKDWRQEKREGVTLDTYAKVSVALTRSPGANVEDVLAKNGIPGKARWQMVNDSWIQAMKDDKTASLVQQYGALYQKYAGPKFAAEQDAVTANALSGRQTQAATPAPTRPTPETLDQVAARMAASKGRPRMEASREYARECDRWNSVGGKDPKDPRASRCAAGVMSRDLAPVLVDSIEHAEDDTIEYAVNVSQYLVDLKLQSDDARLALRRVLRRSEDRLATLEASFAPIKDKAVPERILLRSRIDAYTNAVKRLKQILASW
jgi:hypothetical protein